MENFIKTKQICFYYIDTAKDLKELTNNFKDVALIGLDTETYALSEDYGLQSSALDPFTSSISLLQVISEKDKFPYVIDCLSIGHKYLKEFVLTILNNPNIIKVAFNFPFDLKVIRRNFGIWLPNCRCVQIQMKLIGAATGYKFHRALGFSYGSLVKNYFKVNIDKSQGSSDWKRRPLSKSQLVYSALDVGATTDFAHSSFLLAAYSKFLKLIETKEPFGYEMKNVHQIDQNAMVEVAKMEYAGLPVNVNFIEKAIPALLESISEQEILVARLLNLPVEQTLLFESGMPQVKYCLQETTKTILKSPTVLINKVQEKFQYYNEELVSLQAEDIELIINQLKELPTTKTISHDLKLLEELLQLKKLHKILDKDWLNLINPVTKRIHAQYNTIGTATGRMSSRSNIFGQNFNAQQISKKSFVVSISEEDFQSSNK